MNTPQKNKTIKKVKKVVLATFFFIILFFLLIPGDFPDNAQFKNSLESIDPNHIVIIFNSGGWGNTPPEEAADFAPIIKGIQATLNDLGYTSVVVPYERAKDSFLGRVEGLREILTSFQKQSRKLACDIESSIQSNPQVKIIMAGLSNGGVFVDKVMEKIPEHKQNSILAIEVGVPFWEEPLESPNVLLVNNEGEDPLVKNEAQTLIFSLIKAPFKWAQAKISGRNLSFSHALHVSGHDYAWESPATGPRIKTFLQEKIH